MEKKKKSLFSFFKFYKFLLSSQPILARVDFLKKRYVLYIIFVQPAWTEVTFLSFYF